MQSLFKPWELDNLLITTLHPLASASVHTRWQPNQFPHPLFIKYYIVCSLNKNHEKQVLPSLP